MIHFKDIQVAISEFKANCIEMLKHSQAFGEELVVMLRGKPLVRVVGVGGKSQRVLGGQNGVVSMPADQNSLIRSDFENDWES